MSHKYLYLIIIIMLVAAGFSLHLICASGQQSQKPEARRTIPARPIPEEKINQAKQLIEPAIKFAYQIQDPAERSEALAEAAAVLVEIDRRRAKNLFDYVFKLFGKNWRLDHIDILPSVAKLDLNKALAVADEIDWSSGKARALSDIASELVKIDKAVRLKLFEKAIAVAYKPDEIDWGFEEAMVLRDIASELAKIDKGAALAVFKKAIAVADNLDNPFYRDTYKNLYKAWVLRDIASELAKVDYKKAIAVANKIDRPFFTAQALKDIASELVKIDKGFALKMFKEALVGADKLDVTFRKEGPLLQADLLRDIASELAKIDYKEALALADEIYEPRSKAEALKNIASQLAKINYKKALAAIKLLKKPLDKVKLLSYTAAAIIRSD